MKEFSAFTESTHFDPSISSSSVVDLKAQYQLYISGKWVEPLARQYRDIVNPATGEILTSVAASSVADVDRAVHAARVAYKGVWSDYQPLQRAKLLYKLAQLLEEHTEEFAVLESLNTGETITSCRTSDIPRAVREIFYNAGWADKLEYAFAGRSVRPLGVCGLVLPWDSPLLMAARKMAPALACGNTVVIKSAETTPLTLLRLAELAEEAGFPAGVINIVTGDEKVGEALVASKDVDKVSFTGSTAVGKRIQAVIAGTHKRFTLELGGKSAQIVFDDAAIDQAVEGVVKGMFFNQGQVCCAGSRLLLQEGVSEVFMEKLKERVSQLSVGNPLDSNVDIGVIHTEKQLEKIQLFIQQAEKEHCEIWSAEGDLSKPNQWMKPVIISEVSQSSMIIQEEIFGPVLTVQTFRTIDEAVSLANGTKFGLAAGIWTEKGSKSLAVANKLKAGVIWSNCYSAFDSSAPFGGYKQSGIGRKGGVQGLYPFVEITF